MEKLFNFLFVLLLSVTCSKSRLSSVPEQYQKAITAYERENWSNCIAHFEKTIQLYKLYRNVVNGCRLKCNSELKESDTSIIKEDIEDLKVFERYFKLKNCIVSCQNEEFEKHHLKADLDNITLSDIKQRKVYEYLHTCYFQMNHFSKAASAVYTFLVANPHDEAMQTTMNYYLQHPSINTNEIVDVFSEAYNSVIYKLGLKAFQDENWSETIENMEELVNDYFSWENECRVECERQPEQDWSPESTIIISSYMFSYLQCRQQCQRVLLHIGFNSGKEFLAEILNYLKTSYYRLDRLKEAAKALKTYLFLKPEEEERLYNDDYYVTLSTRDGFVERSEIVFYAKRDSYEKILLELGKDRFWSIKAGLKTDFGPTFIDKKFKNSSYALDIKKPNWSLYIRKSHYK